MKTPTWAIVIGICLILFGGCSVTKNIQSINMPEMLEMQQNMMENMTSPTTTNSSTTTSSDSLLTESNVDTTYIQSDEMFKIINEGMHGMFAISDFTKTWTVRFGYIGLLVSIIYILSGVFLLIKKKFSINLVYAALIISIVFSGIESLVLASDSTAGLLTKFAGFGNIFGIIIDIILIVVVVAMDKSAYNDNTKEIA